MTENIFRWRDTEEEKPPLMAFGKSHEVIGLDKYRNRKIYVYIRGEWFYSTNYSSQPVEPPVKWHYLPMRPFLTRDENHNLLEIKDESNRTTT